MVQLECNYGATGIEDCSQSFEKSILKVGFSIRYTE